jgi:hypothetical protein
MIAFVSLSGRSTILYEKEFRFIRIFMRVQYIVDSHNQLLLRIWTPGSSQERGALTSLNIFRDAGARR